jgi:hypothetical protein
MDGTVSRTVAGGEGMHWGSARANGAARSASSGRAADERASV